MRIAHYAPNLWAPGGIATYVRRLGAAQTIRGHDVRYYSGPTGPAPVPTATVTDASALYAALRRDGMDVLHLHKPVDALPPDDLAVVRTMHGNQGSCPSGTRFLKRSGRPCPRDANPLGCLWGHLVDHCGSRRPGTIRSNVQRHVWEKELATRIRTLPVSDFVRDAMIRAGCPADQLTVIPSPAPPVRTPYTPPPVDGPPRMVYAGRLAAEKGVDWLLEAAAQVPEVHVDIAGSGTASIEAALYRQVDDLGLSDRVTFHGWMEPNALDALYAAARAVVVPSVWHEPAGLVTLEAAGRGRAVIASAVGGIPEYAHPDFALLAPPRDVAALAAHLRTLATDYPAAARLGRQGRTRVRTSYAMNDYLDALDAVYDAVRTTSPPITAGRKA